MTKPLHLALISLHYGNYVGSGRTLSPKWHPYITDVVTKNNTPRCRNVSAGRLRFLLTKCQILSASVDWKLYLVFIRKWKLCPLMSTVPQLADIVTRKTKFIIKFAEVTRKMVANVCKLCGNEGLIFWFRAYHGRVGNLKSPVARQKHIFVLSKCKKNLDDR